MSSKTQGIKVTFGKQDTSNRLTYPTTAIILNGVPVGEITTYKEDISLSLTPKIKVTGYEVCIWGQDGIEDANFNTEDYTSARSALAAAKRYAKETLSAPAPQEEETPAAIEPTAEEARVEEINAEVKQLRASAASVKDVEEEVLALERERADLLYGAETPAAIEPTEVDEALETRNPYYHLWVRRGDSWEYNSSWYDLRNRDAQRAALEARGLEVKSDFQACKDGVLEGKHNGAYVYDIPCNCPKCTALQEVEGEALPALQEETLEPLIKALPAPVPPPEVEEEARVIRVTPPQVAALRALGYEVKSCKLRLLPSQEEGLLARLYAEREEHTRGAKRVYTSLIERVSKPKSRIKAAKGAPRAYFSPGDLRIEYADANAHIQLMQLVDAAESAGLISQASASALRASTRATPPPAPEEEREDTGGSALARFWGEED